MRPIFCALVSTRLRRCAAWAAGLFLCYTLFGFLILPSLVRAVAVKRLARQMEREVSIRQVRINPLILSVTVRGLMIRDKDNTPLVTWDEFYANFQLSSLFRWAWTFDEIRLGTPRVEISLDANGRLNFADLLVPKTNSPPFKPQIKTGLPRLLVFNLSVTNGYVRFADRSRKTPFSTVYDPINLHLTRFATRPDQSSLYSFEASGEAGSRLAWAGILTAQPPASRGTLRIQDMPLPKHAPYFEAYTRVQLADGTFNVDGGYRFELGTNGLDLVVSNLAATVSQLRLKDPDTGEAVLTLPSTELRNGLLDWRARQTRVGSLRLINPTALVRRRADGTINLPALFLARVPEARRQTNAPASDSESHYPWVFTLDDYRLESGSVEFEDATLPQPFRSTLKPVELHLEHFTTAPNTNATLHASVTTETAEVVTFAADCSINPMSASGNLKLAGLELRKYQPYLAPFFRGQIAAGKTDVALEFSGRHGTNTDAIAISQAVVRVADLQIQSPAGDETLVKLPSLAIENTSADLPAKTIHVGAIKSAGATLFARRDASGTINLLGLLATNPPPPSAVAATPVAPAAASSWNMNLDELALRDYAVHFEDRQLPQPAVLEVDQLALTLRGAQFPSNAPVQANFSARLNAAGTVAVRGSLWPYTPAAEAEVAVSGLELSRFQRWLEPQVKLVLNHGALNSTGRVKFASANRNGPLVHFDGNLAVTNLLTTDLAFSKEFLRWDEFALLGLNLDFQPNKAVVEQARFTGLRTGIIIGPDKRLNLLAALPDSTHSNAVPTPAASASAANSFPMQLGELKFDHASIHFEDHSIQPPCVFDLKQFAGGVKGLSTKPDATAEVDLAGVVDEASPFGLHGTARPLAGALSLNLAFTNSNLQLTPFTPYMEKYVGHPLNKGRLTLNLDYVVQENGLKAENKVRIDQLLLGPRNDSRDAPKLPVKLAVALLKDNNGRIDLNLPVEGRLDDPQFRLAPIILKVLVNLIVKAAASPFKLLGALVGGGEEMSYVDFRAGLAQLSDTETNKLDKLIAALVKRPALNLEIEGSIHPVADRDALARGLVQDHIKSLRLKELALIGQVPAPGEAFEIAPADRERLLRAELTQIFGTNLTEAVQGLAARAAATNAIAAARPKIRDPGLIKRLLTLFKPRKERAATLQTHRHAKADALLLKQNPELATLTAEDMERLLAAKTEVPLESLRQLLQNRAKAVQAYLLATGQLTAERLFLVAPKTPDASFQGDARVNLSLE
jgi:uncharacterized protein involved in outer membrane biogenesis